MPSLEAWVEGGERGAVAGPFVPLVAALKPASGEAAIGAPPDAVLPSTGGTTAAEGDGAACGSVTGSVARVASRLGPDGAVACRKSVGPQAARVSRAPSSGGGRNGTLRAVQAALHARATQRGGRGHSSSPKT